MNQLKEDKKTEVRPPDPAYLQISLPLWAAAETKKTFVDTPLACLKANDDNKVAGNMLTES